MLLKEIGALRGKIVTAFHGEDITNYRSYLPARHYAPLFARGDPFLPISARRNEALAALGCPMDRARVHRMGVDIRDFPERPSDPAGDGPLRQQLEALARETAGSPRSWKIPCRASRSRRGM